MNMIKIPMSLNLLSHQRGHGLLLLHQWVFIFLASSQSFQRTIKPNPLPLRNLQFTNLVLQILNCEVNVPMPLEGCHSHLPSQIFMPSVNPSCDKVEGHVDDKQDAPKKTPFPTFPSINPQYVEPFIAYLAYHYMPLGNVEQLM